MKALTCALQNVENHLDHKAVRAEQREAIIPFVQGKDVFVSLATPMSRVLPATTSRQLLASCYCPHSIAFGMRLDTSDIRKAIIRNNIRKVKKPI